MVEAAIPSMALAPLTGLQLACADVLYVTLVPMLLVCTKQNAGDPAQGFVIFFAYIHTWKDWAEDLSFSLCSTLRIHHCSCACSCINVFISAANLCNCWAWPQSLILHQVHLNLA